MSEIGPRQGTRGIFICGYKYSDNYKQDNFTNPTRSDMRKRVCVDTVRKYFNRLRKVYAFSTECFSFTLFTFDILRHFYLNILPDIFIQMHI